MVQTPPKSTRLVIELPDTLLLQVTSAQFEKLALANCDLRLERTATGDLIVNPPTGWETGLTPQTIQPTSRYIVIQLNQVLITLSNLKIKQKY